MRKSLLLRSTKWAFCISRTPFFVLISVAFIVVFLILVLNFDGFYTEREEILRIARKMMELSENMNYLKHLDKEKQKSLIELQNRYKLLISQLDEKRFFDANISKNDLQSLKNRFKSVKYNDILDESPLNGIKE
uniref:Uncharacterized protein n=1 Tax=Romanomermis culicivorax TaxID=13658 RepID=A0A915J0A9_ROMCU